MYVSSIRQLFPTGRLRLRNAFSSTGNSLSAQRCTVESHKGDFLRGVINADPTLSDHFFNVPQTQRIGDIPAYAHHEHVERVMHAVEHARHSWIQAPLHGSHRSSSFLEHSRPPYCDKTHAATHCCVSSPSSRAVSSVGAHQQVESIGMSYRISIEC